MTPPTQREQLDAALGRLVDAVVDGDVARARQAYADAHAFDLGTAGRDAQTWAERERVRARRLRDDLDHEPRSFGRGGAT